MEINQKLWVAASGLLLALLLVWVAMGRSDKSSISAPQANQRSVVDQPAIPPDVFYSLITRDELPGEGLRLQIRINRVVPKDVLRVIAMTLKSSQPRPYQRTFILYYLPGMTPGNGAWAATDFDSKLNIQIFGFTAEQPADVTTSPSRDQEMIGRWIDNFPGSSCRIMIYRVNGQLLMDRRFQDGSSGKITLVEKQSPWGRRFENIEGSDSGDNFVLTPSGDLQIRDNTGLISIAKPVK